MIISLSWEGENVMPGKVRVIPANTNEPMKHVVIYARVSSNTMDQLESLKAQVSELTKFISGHNNWKLVDIHIDIASAKKDSFRPAFHQMIEECKAGLTDIVVVKSTLGIVKELKDRNINSLTGKDNWPKRSVEKMLSNEKYIGISVVNVGGKEGQIYKLNNSHPAIISKEMFDAVQKEKKHRTNVELTSDGIKRKSQKYSSKR